MDNKTPREDYTGNTNLRDWWKIVKENFANIFSYVNEVRRDLNNVDKTYDSVKYMISDDSLKPGMLATTTGYHSPNDGGGATYIIRKRTDAEADPDNVFSYGVGDYVAELIVENSTINIRQVGAKSGKLNGDELYTNTYLIQTCLDNLVFAQVLIPRGTFYHEGLKINRTMHLIGESNNLSSLKNVGTGDSITLGENIFNCVVKDLAILGDGDYLSKPYTAGQCGKGIVLNHFNAGLILDNVMVRYHNDDQIYFCGSGHLNNVYIKNCDVSYGGKSGITIMQKDNSNQVNAIYIQNSNITGYPNNGVNAWGCNFVIQNNTIQACSRGISFDCENENMDSTHEVSTVNCIRGVVIRDNYFEQCTDCFIYANPKIIYKDEKEIAHYIGGMLVEGNFGIITVGKGNSNTACVKINGQSLGLTSNIHPISGFVYKANGFSNLNNQTLLDGGSCLYADSIIYTSEFNSSDVGYSSKFKNLGQAVIHYGFLQKGSTDKRPTHKDVPIGFQYYDTNLNKAVWWDGKDWRSHPYAEEGVTADQVALPPNKGYQTENVMLELEAINDNITGLKTTVSNKADALALDSEKMTPLVLTDTKETPLLDYKIYGSTDGVGVLNEETGKYDVNLITCGKNLLLNNWILNGDYALTGLTYKINEDGTLQVEAGASKFDNYPIIFKMAESYIVPCDCTLTFRCLNSSTKSVYFTLILYAADGTKREQWEFYNSNPKTFEAYAGEKIFIRSGQVPNVEISNDVTFYPQLELGEVATDFEPYVEPVTTNICIPEPLTEGDYIDYSNRKVVAQGVEYTELELPEISTFYPSTSIMCDGEVQVKYEADTTNAYNNLKNKLDELTQAIISVTNTEE